MPQPQSDGTGRRPWLRRFADLGMLVDLVGLAAFVIVIGYFLFFD
ncbi:MAG: hypothetical protein ABL963_04950 [Longimicrobiales bacterium]